MEKKSKEPKVIAKKPLAKKIAKGLTPGKAKRRGKN